MELFGLGPAELLVIAVVFLLLYDPDKLPEIARNMGKLVRQFRRVASDLSRDLSAEEILPKDELSAGSSKGAGIPQSEEKRDKPSAPTGSDSPPPDALNKAS